MNQEGDGEPKNDVSSGETEGHKFDEWFEKALARGAGWKKSHYTPGSGRHDPYKNGRPSRPGEPPGRRRVPPP